MVQVIGPGRQKPTFGQKLGAGFQKALSQYGEHAEKEKAKQLMAQEDIAAEEMGIKLKGISDPKIRQEVIKQGLEYSNKKKYIDQLGLGNEFGQESQNKPNEEFSNQNTQDHINPETGDVDVGNVKVKTAPKRIPQSKINAAALVEPNLAKSWTEQNKAIDKEEARKEKAQTQERQFFHKESGSYDEALSTQALAAEKKNRSLDRQIANVDKIGWWDRFISTGIAGPLTDVLRSKTAQEFDANTLAQLEGQRQLLGGVLSDSDIRLLMQKIVTASKDPEANKYIAQFMKLENEIPILKKHIADELKSENGGYRPANFQSEIDKVFNLRYGDEIKQMQNDIINLPDDNKKLDKIGRRSVPPGTPLGEDSILMYLKLADNDPDIATQMAKRDGYDIPE